MESVITGRQVQLVPKIVPQAQEVEIAEQDVQLIPNVAHLWCVIAITMSVGFNQFVERLLLQHQLLLQPPNVVVTAVPQMPSVLLLLE